MPCQHIRELQTVIRQSGFLVHPVLVLRNANLDLFPIFCAESVCFSFVLSVSGFSLFQEAAASAFNAALFCYLCILHCAVCCMYAAYAVDGKLWWNSTAMTGCSRRLCLCLLWPWPAVTLTSNPSSENLIIMSPGPGSYVTTLRWNQLQQLRR